VIVIGAANDVITTEAWVLHKGPSNAEPGELKKEAYSFPDISEHEVLAEPIYGCWEANMTHALQRQPIDVCRLRGEAKVVLGNAGVVRVLRTGSAVTRVREGALCVVVPIGSWDAAGYPLTILAYDAPGTMGLLAKQMKLHERQLFPLLILEESKYSIQQWAAFSIRYGTAWDNWQVAYGAWRLQMMPDGRVGEENGPTTYVWGWGGGVAHPILPMICLFAKPPLSSAKSLICRSGKSPLMAQNLSASTL
jgi:NADPH:quinone reductase-like Zn-dependent oxidoreductase